MLVVASPLTETNEQQINNSTYGFIKNFCNFAFDYRGIPLKLMQVNFDLNDYKKNLYSKFNIECPKPIQTSVPKRQAEFFAGRFCAKYLMEADQGYSINVPISSDRSPKWPNEMTGSISHTDDSAVAVIYKKEHLNSKISLGVDIQNLISTLQSESIQPLIAVTTELSLLKAHGYSSEYCTTLLFSAKESIYKAIYPHMYQILDFDDIKLSTINYHTSTMTFSTSANLINNFNINETIECYYRYDINRAQILTLCVYEPNL